MGDLKTGTMAKREFVETLPRLALYVSLLGWFILGFYALFIYVEYEQVSQLAEDLFSPSRIGVRARSMVLFAPLISTILGYFVNERAKFLKKLLEAEEKLNASYMELADLHEGLMFAFARALDAKSHWTKGHSERVTAYALMIAKEMDMGEENMATLKTAALLHDIGKIGTVNGILDKADKLTDEEYARVKMHPGEGEEILKPIKQFEEVRSVIRHHHEHMDGSGYPDGLKGDEIPILSRVLCVADSFDAMTADRPYRSASGREYAISELKRYSGTQFDAGAVNAFIRALRGQESAEDVRLKHFNIVADSPL